MTGKPIGDYLVDPNVVGRSEEADAIDGLTNEAPTVETKRGDETKPSIRIHIDTSEPDWLDKVGEAYVRAAKALGFDPADFEGKPPILLKGDADGMPEGFIDKREEFAKRQEAKRKR